MFVIFDGILLAAFVWVPYDLLITASMLNFNLTIMLFLAAYVVLKRRHPHKNWLYGKTWHVALLLVLAPAGGTVAMSVFTIIDDYELFGVPNINLMSLLFILGMGIAVHSLFALSAWLRGRPQKETDPETIHLLTRTKNESEC